MDDRPSDPYPHHFTTLVPQKVYRNILEINENATLVFSVSFQHGLGHQLFVLIIQLIFTYAIKRSFFVLIDCQDALFESTCSNKSPKGHWSLTWVQWALLLKVRFLSKSESMTAIFVKSVRTATIAIFQFRIRGCIRFVAVAFRSEEEVLWRRNPSLTYFWQIAPPPLDPPLGGVCRKAYTQVRDYEYFISIKFHKHPSSGSVGKADYVSRYIYMH